MSNRFSAATPTVTRNRFAVLDEEGEHPSPVPVVPVPVVQVASATSPKPETKPGGSYSDCIRSRKAASPPKTLNIASQREFPALGAGAGASVTAKSDAASSWAAKAHAFAEHDARMKEAHAFTAKRKEMERSQFGGIGIFRIPKAHTVPTVADYEEEDRLRGLLGMNDSYTYEYTYRGESLTPPYPPYDENEEEENTNV